ncbi:kynurenine/alpha-aminoadipate aminotransferase, mitochondrial [Patella vulgata]|uniref:kynurenine/alpha-aminoadipate aminotransferase, mitochondrial n=1 Tax=Patella vulgata TaxID=6465 RepID=UPI00217F5EA2|nr:kynurenine/alpha-aminoadipate aminotransferase, mitochondrial [Patella vulgata]
MAKQNGLGNICRIQYEKYFSKLARRTKSSVLRDAAEASELKNKIIMSGGYPSPEIFPIISSQLTLRDGTVLKIDEESQKDSLQYCSTWGMDDLRQWLKDFQKKIHNPPSVGEDKHPGEMELMITAGSQDGISTGFQMLIDEGDSVIVQNPTYPSVFSMVERLGGSTVGIDSDKHGIIPSKMRTLLENWEISNPVNKNAPRPKVLYCIPTGENPRSASWSFERRQAVYQICREFNLLIMEDDPYYFTYFNRPLPRSMLSIDEDGRVLRFDTFSKVLGPGLRIGYLTGPRPLVGKLMLLYQTSTSLACPFSQVIIMTLLREWGVEGFIQQCDRTAQFLKEQADYLLLTANTYLSDVAEWEAPNAGMFLWMKMKGFEDTRGLVKRCKEEGLLLIEGVYAIPGGTMSPYIRIAFAIASKQQMIEACKILAKVSKELRGIPEN